MQLGCATPRAGNFLSCRTKVNEAKFSGCPGIQFHAQISTQHSRIAEG